MALTQAITPEFVIHLIYGEKRKFNKEEFERLLFREILQEILDDLRKEGIKPSLEKILERIKNEDGKIVIKIYKNMAFHPDALAFGFSSKEEWQIGGFGIGLKMALAGLKMLGYDPILISREATIKVEEKTGICGKKLLVYDVSCGENIKGTILILKGNPKRIYRVIKELVFDDKNSKEITPDIQIKYSKHPKTTVKLYVNGLYMTSVRLPYEIPIESINVPSDIIRLDISRRYVWNIHDVIKEIALNDEKVLQALYSIKDKGENHIAIEFKVTWPEVIRRVLEKYIKGRKIAFARLSLNLEKILHHFYSSSARNDYFLVVSNIDYRDLKRAFPEFEVEELGSLCFDDLFEILLNTIPPNKLFTNYPEYFVEVAGMILVALEIYQRLREKGLKVCFFDLLQTSKALTESSTICFRVGANLEEFLHEAAHIASGAGDCTNKFEEALTKGLGKGKDPLIEFSMEIAKQIADLFIERAYENLYGKKPRGTIDKPLPNLNIFRKMLTNYIHRLLKNRTGEIWKIICSCISEYFSSVKRRYIIINDVYNVLDKIVNKIYKLEAIERLYKDACEIYSRIKDIGSAAFLF